MAVQIAAVWVTLRAARARRTVLVFANVALGVAALAAIVSLVVDDQFHTDSIVAWVSCALYLAAPVAIVRHLLSRQTNDSETVMGAIAAYLMAGMFFAFLYRRHRHRADRTRRSSAPRARARSPRTCSSRSPRSPPPGTGT